MEVQLVIMYTKHITPMQTTPPKRCITYALGCPGAAGPCEEQEGDMENTKRRQNSTKYVEGRKSAVSKTNIETHYSNIYMDSLRENCPSHIHVYIKCYINASRLNRYIFRTVNAINILFSTLHTTPFLYGRVLFGISQLLLASIATFDTPPGSNPP